MPLQATSGAASYDAFGGGVAAVPNYIEDVFSTYLYKGNASTQTITNGIDLSGKGGMVWTKSRTNANEALIYDTVRGVNNYIIPSSTQEAQTSSATLTAFNSNGFTLGANDNSNDSTTENSVGWTFREQPKFFDVVTYTGDGNNARTIAHNLGSTPGFVIIKKTDSTGNWMCWHNSFASTDYIALNTTGAKNYAGSLTDIFQGVSSTTVTVGSNGVVNSSVNSYVMYVFASNAGGFGLTGTDNVISCGSYTGNGSATGPVITLGYEPQWVMIKKTSDIGNWHMHDIMRDMSVTSNSLLWANLSDAEVAGASAKIAPLATGFQITNSTNGENESGGTFIYIAIRRGPMKVPTSGTSVFSPNAVTMTASGSATITTNFPVDLSFNRKRSAADQYVMDRLRGGSQTSYNYLRTQTTGAETTGSSVGVGFDSNTSLVDNNWLSGVSANTIWWSFRRAPSFFDEVCYIGVGYGERQDHNLTVRPELIIIKNRSAVQNWVTVWLSPDGTNSYNSLSLNTTSSFSNPDGDDLSYWVTPSNFYTGYLKNSSGQTPTNSGNNFVAYLFATCAGVSKVGSYTGTGTTLQVDCGFTGGARFVLIKRTDSTGDWYVWDSARGIVSGNDPYLLLNSTAAEVTSTDYIDTYSAGFEISSTAPAAINASGGTFIFLAIA